ncbi:hexon [Perilla frutescens var. hirtella]|uniref:Hexon n=1 Tax=Perilla frutescens var. hirtella TaxID=608512 RepID=A0AAD4IWR7_PERFH|nr:hexon [Perilla frutescens var. frutescens]KAH6786405.1 hexon [Perilla frutescens var. hirtella]KAH6822781.1 hexon [Perilla frutescens var. hirtella]
MVQTLEAIRGGGGSVKIGTTGKISALMSREIESTKAASKVPSLSTSSVSVSASDIAPRKLQSRSSIDEASSSRAAINMESDKCPGTVRKMKHRTGRTHHIPMLAADNISLDGTPIRQKPNRRVTGMVEVVDIRCGNPDKTWRNPITNRLKKLGFSKLSESIG